MASRSSNLNSAFRTGLWDLLVKRALDEITVDEMIIFGETILEYSTKEHDSAVQLAIGVGRSRSDLLALFDSAAEEAGLAVPPVDYAVRDSVRTACEGILFGTLDPADGAERVWDLSQKEADLRESTKLDPFIYAASSLREEMNERARADLEEQLVATARDYIRSDAT